MTTVLYGSPGHQHTHVYTTYAEALENAVAAVAAGIQAQIREKVGQ